MESQILMNAQELLLLINDGGTIDIQSFYTKIVVLDCT